MKLFFCRSTTRDTSSLAFLVFSCLGLKSSLLVMSHYWLPVSPSSHGRAVLYLYRLPLQRVQSFWNLVHSCWRQVVQRFLSASSLSAPRLDDLGCHSGPGLSREQLSLGIASPLFGFAPSGLPTRNIPCRYCSFYGCRQRQPLRLLVVLNFFHMSLSSSTVSMVLVISSSYFLVFSSSRTVPFRSCIVSFV